MKRKVGIILIILFLILVAFITNGCSQLSNKESRVKEAFSELVPQLSARYLTTKETIELMVNIGGERDVTNEGLEAISDFEKALEADNANDQLNAARRIEVIIGRLNSNAQSSPVLSKSEDLSVSLQAINEALPALDVRQNYDKAINEYEESRSSFSNSFSSILGGYSNSKKLEFWIPEQPDS